MVSVKKKLVKETLYAVQRIRMERYYIRWCDCM